MPIWQKRQRYSSLKRSTSHPKGLGLHLCNMRIRDATISKHRSRSTESFFLVVRCRKALLSNALTCFFLRDVLYAEEEQALSRERRIRIRETRFALDSLDDQTCLQRFRFSKADIYRIVAKLGWPEERNVTARRRYRTTDVFSFCVLARRLGNICRWSDLEFEFGRPACDLSEIFYEALEFMFESFGPLVTSFRSTFLQQRAPMYAEAIHGAGAALDSAVGFIDGTNLYIARPAGLLQRSTYNGHKRRNCLKMQAVSTPDGLVYHMFGPEEGRRHDMTLFRRSGIEEHLASSLLVGGRQFYIYGDPAYVLRPYLQVGFKGSVLSDEQKAFNKSMSLVRVSVEWAFKDLKKYFTHVDSSRKMVLQKVPVAKWYLVSAVLWNFRACMYGSQSATFFNCSAPSFEDYISSV